MAENWIVTNQRYLTAALEEVRGMLERHLSRSAGEIPVQSTSQPVASSYDDTTTPPALVRLCTVFGLSSFERAIILLCAGIELDASFAALCAQAQNDPARSYPTFSLALATLDEPHWSALAPEAPLRRWRLIEMTGQPGTPLTTSPLRIDERVLHFLTGIQYLDDRLAGFIEPVRENGDLVPSHQALVHHITQVWTQTETELPIVQLCGNDEQSKRRITAAACEAMGMGLFALAAETIPLNATEIEGLVRIWEREAALSSCALYVDATTVDQSDTRSTATISRLLERLHGGVLLGTGDRWKPLRRASITLDVGKPTVDEQRNLWQASLEDVGVGLNGQLAGLVAQFNLNASSIQNAAHEATLAATEGQRLAEALWNASRAQARPHLDDLAQRIVPVAGWDDLVVPDTERRLLEEIAQQVAHRATVYQDWGFGKTSNRGLGINALFSGASGTGKTMAAEVLANHLQLDLYRIDLSSVVSKYIGETEKNLRRVFDAAEDGGAILFFDEADALFGKRSEVKDSHDRYANIEINYLLQRMEAYRGLAILATNMKSALDPAFLRRIRFVVNFPFPDPAQRAEIWKGIFPKETPTNNLDIGKLARLKITGGNIRNIAMNAAFLAASAGEPVSMAHLMRATHTEFAKLEKPLNEAEFGGW